MARVPLAAMVKRARPRSKVIVMRQVIIPATLASDLFATAYLPILQAWEKAIPGIVAQYEASLAAYTKDAPEDIGAAISAGEKMAAQVILPIKLRLSEWAMRVERLHRSKWAASVASATGVRINTMIGPEAAKVPVASVVEANVALIRSISEEESRRIGHAVFSGLQRRAPAREIAKEIRAAAAMTRRRALNIASDQTSKLAASLNEERRREVGIDTWQWVSSHKVHYRPAHKARDGKRYSDSNPPPDMPGQLIHCGCTSRAVLSLDGEF